MAVSSFSSSRFSLNDSFLFSILLSDAVFLLLAGCLIVVSHDRYFLDRTVDHLFRMEPHGKVKMYPGNYSAFLEVKAAEETEASQKAKVKS